MPPQSQEQLQVYIVNTDLAVERQNILKEKLDAYFVVLNQQTPNVVRELTYVINSDNKPATNVLLANKEADVLFTGFHFEKKPTVQKKQALIIGESQQNMLDIDPTLRYSGILELKKLVERDMFRQRLLIYVGDLRERIRDCVKLNIKVKVVLFADEQRSKTLKPLAIDDLEQVPLPDEEITERQIDISMVDRILIGGIPFDGVINMTEEGNKFFIKDASIIDTSRKMFQLEDRKDTVAQELLVEEKLAFVRQKKVFIVLNPDLKKVVSERLHFDKMDKLFEFPDMEKAIAFLTEGKSKGIVDYLETEGYDVINTVLNQNERDQLLVAGLGNQIYPYLEKELKTQGDYLHLLDEGFIRDMFHGLAEEIISSILDKLKDASYDKFLSLVPMDIRQNLILKFFEQKKQALSAWKTITKDGRKDILKQHTVEILANLNLTNTSLFKNKFPKIKFEFDKNYDSTQSLGKLNKESKEFYFNLFKKGLSTKKFPAKIWSDSFSQEEFDDAIGNYISMHPSTFYNGLTPVMRKSMWNLVGYEYRDVINKKLHYLDKVKILEGSKEAVLKIIKQISPLLMQFLKKGKTPDITAGLFLGLKKLNKVESKTALLKKVIDDPKYKKIRIHGISALLRSTEGKSIFDKLTQHVSALSQGFHSLICMSENEKALREFDELKDAMVTLVDKEVDPSLLNMFKNAKVDLNDYDKYVKDIEQKIAALKKKLLEIGKEDPVGTYLLESMIVVMEISANALKKELSADMIQQLDEREEVKNSIIQQMEKTLQELSEQVEQFRASLLDIEADLSTKNQHLKQMKTALEKDRTLLQKEIALFENSQAQLNKSLALKKKISLLQLNLSKSFFKIIRPLILQKMNNYPAPIMNLIRYLRNVITRPESLRKRIIFKFTDDEIREIFRRKIVFTTDNQILKQFIVTCLDIDQLKNDLFVITGSATIPPQLDLLFVGPDLIEHDFSDLIREKNVIPFADNKFQQTLSYNEELKKKTKLALNKYSVAVKKTKALSEKHAQLLKGKIRNLTLTENAVKELAKNKKKLSVAIRTNQEKAMSLNSEKETINDKFQKIDQQFSQIKTKIQTTLEKGDSVAGEASQAAESMGKELTGTLMEISEAMAKMMFIKSVKDTGEKISKKTQDSIIKKMDEDSRFSLTPSEIKEIIIVDDGSLESQTLKRSIKSAFSSYFTIKESIIREISFARMEHTITSEKPSQSIIIIIGEDKEAEYETFIKIAKEIKINLERTFLLIFTPYGKINRGGIKEAHHEKIQILNDLCKLVNTTTLDFSKKRRVIKLLREIAPS